MIKTSALILLLLFSLSLAGCKSDEQVVENCKVVLEGLDQCVEQRGNSSSCDSAVEGIRHSLSQTAVNDFNRTMWVSDCRSLCSGAYEYRPIVRGNYESICTNSEVITLKDDRFRNLVVLSGLWLVSCVILFFAIRSAIRIRRFRKTGIKVKGVVTGHNTTQSKGSTLYAPIIEFKDWMGRVHTLTSNMYVNSMGKPGESVSSVVNVIYPKDKPEDARTDSFSSLWFVPFILFVFGGVFALASGYGLFGAKEWQGHHRYLQQHIPAIADVSNNVVHAIKSSSLIFTSISNYRIINEKPDTIVMEIDYRLSPFKSLDNVYLGAYAMTDGGNSTGTAYRPARLHKGSGTAQVLLTMSRDRIDEYCSNQIEFSMYIGGESSFFKRVVPYEKCWSRE